MIDLSGFRGESETDEEFAASSAAILADVGEQEIPEAKAEDKAEDASAVAEAEDSQEQPDAEPEPEPLELEKATAALRRGGHDDEDIKAMSRARILKIGLHLAKVQADGDRVFTANKALEDRLKALEASKSEKTAAPDPTAPDELDELKETLVLEHGEAVATALVEVLRKNQGRAAAAEAVVQEFMAKQARDEQQRAFVKSFPEGADPEVFEDVYAMALTVEARAAKRGETLTPAECLEKAASKLKLKTSAEIARASNADKNAVKKNGSSEVNGRKNAAKPKNSEDAEFEAWLARQRGASADDMTKILNSAR